VSIAIGAFADMDRLPHFDGMVAYPALLVLHKISVDEDAILPYFPNLVEAAPGKFNATPFVMAHNIPFHALHIWPHSIKMSPDQSDPCFAIPKLYLRSVHLNHPTKKMKPVCSPWKIVSLIVCKTP
jgi:hypothetical protein